MNRIARHRRPSLSALPDHGALQAGDRIGRRDAAAGRTRCSSCGCGRTGSRRRRTTASRRASCAGVAHVVDQGPGAVERRPGRDSRGSRRPRRRPSSRCRSRCIRSPASAARRSRRRRRHHGEVGRRRAARLEVALGVAPLVEERRHVDRQVLDHGEVAQRLEPQRAVGAAASLTRVRQVQRGRPFTTMAQEPHMPTRQAKR